MDAEPLHWLPDGSPYSKRFGDRYRSRRGGLEQALAMGVHCDAVYQDGFTPTCNPGMWSPAVMQAPSAGSQLATGD